VLGQDFTFEQLCQMTELSEREGLLALDEVRRGGLLREAGTKERLPTDQSCAFTHDKIREVVYLEAGETRRRILHRRAVEILHRATASATALAHHARAASLPEAAFRWSVLAGEEAERLFATMQAHQQYKEALEGLSRLPNSEEVRVHRVESITRLVRVSWTLENPEQLLHRLAEAESLAQMFTGEDRKHLVRVHYWMGFLSFVRHELRQALESFQQVLREAREIGDEDLLTLVAVQMARILAGQGQFGTIEALLTPVLPLLEQSAHWTEWIFALGFLGVSLAARGHYTAGLAASGRALARAQVTESHDHLARSHFFLGMIYHMGGDSAHALEESSRVVDMAQQSGDWVLQYLGHGLRDWTQSRMGKHEEAIVSMIRSQDCGRQQGSRLLLTDWLAAAYAEVLLAADRVEEAHAQAERAVELARSVGGLYGEGVAQRIWAQALVEASPAFWEEACTHLTASLHTLEVGDAILEAARTHVVWGHLCVQLGDLASALEHFEKAAAQFERAGLAAERESVHNYLAPWPDDTS